MKQRKCRITSSNAHKVFIRKRNFETIADDLLNPKPMESLPQILKDNFKHGKIYEPIARKHYGKYVKYTLKHNINIRETGIVIQPKLFWLAASPDGLVSDESDDRLVGLIEIKCPKTRRNSSPEELLKEDKFYMNYVDGKPQLKKTIRLVIILKFKWQWERYKGFI